MKKHIAVLALRCAVALVSIVGGTRLLLTLSRHGITHLPTNVLRVIGVAEIAAAVLFLIPRTMKAGGMALLGVFAAAAAVHLLHSEYDISNLILLVAAIAVVLANE